MRTIKTISLARKQHKLRVINVNLFKFNKFKFGHIGLVLLKKLRFEFIYLKWFIKLIKKKKYLKKKPYFFKKKIYIILPKNYSLSKKSKNSRMGKGKGELLRLVSYIPISTIFIEFKYGIYKNYSFFFKNLRYVFKIKYYIKINNV